MAYYSIQNIESTSMFNNALIDDSAASLFMGVETSNIDMVRCSIDENIDPSRIKHNNGFTLLHSAIYQNNVEIVETLLCYTKDVNVVDAKGKTPLLVAVEKNSNAYNKVQSQNQDTDNENITKYEQEVKQGQEIIEHLLDAGADISIADHHGVNPVFVAVSESNIPLIDCLLHRGLSKDPKSFALMLRDSLHLAARLNNKEVVQILVENYSINVDIESPLGVTPLQIAIEMGHVDMVNYLLDNGANVRGTGQNSYCRKLSELSIKEAADKNTDKNFDGSNLSISDAVASEKNMPKVMEWLLDTPPDSNTSSCSDRESSIPLIVAVQNNKLEIAQILLNRGADPDVVSNNQNSPLHLAVSLDYFEMAELLLKSGADPNEMVDFMGMSSCYLLHCAVLKGNLNIIQTLVDNGAKINIYDKNGNSPLSLAVYLHMHHIVHYFLSIGAFVNSPNSKVQPLHIAIAGNDLESITKLLHFGADIEATDIHGKTALHLATEKDNFTMVQCMINAGAKVNVEYENSDGEILTPLHMATLNRNIQIVKFLIEHGAKCRPENSPIYLAIASGDMDLFNLFWASRYIIEGPESGIYWDTNNTAIHCAVCHDQVRMVKLLYGLGGNLNLPDKEGYSPLFRAMLKQNSKIVSCLVKDGALVNDPCLSNKHKQWMPIHLAAYYGNIEWLQLFIQYGASIHATTENHMCPLWIAVKRGHFDIIKYLLEHRADVHCRNTSRYHNDNTPLHLAIKNRRSDIVKLLIQYKADVNYENSSYQSPLATAICNCDYDIAKYLLKKGAKIYSQSSENQLSTPLMNTAVALNQKSIVRLLLHHGASVDDVDKYGKTPLAIAIERGHVKMVKYLLKHGADVNTAYRVNGKIIVRTLFLAISGKHTQIVKELIKYSVDVNASLNSEKYTPLLMAVVMGYPEIVEMLLNVKNVDIDAVDANGMTALHRAVVNGNKDLAALLIEFGAYVDITDQIGFTSIGYCKDGTVQRLYKLYLTKKQCLNLSNKELAAYVIDDVEDSILNDLIDSCLNELARLKKKSIAGITLYEILTMNSEELTLFFQDITAPQNKQLSQYLKLDKVKAAYPNFIYMLRRKMLCPPNE